MSFRRKISVFVLVIILTFSSFDIIESVTEHCDETNMIESDDIDHQLIGLAQDDPLVIDALKNYYLDKPNSFPRNLDGPLTPFKLQGQFAQARFVDDLYNNSKVDGFFFEAGAFNGESLSNTLHFELNRNWSGILVEANPEEYEKLLSKNRKVYSLGQCLSTVPAVELVTFDAMGVFGGIIQEGRVKPGDNLPADDITQRMKNDIDRKFIKMQCFPLFSLLLAVGNPVLDYLSLDIEGAELKVLQTIPWDLVDIRVISLEICRKKLNEQETNVGEFTDDHDEIVAFLDAKGFKVHMSFPHTPENRAFEVIFIRRDVAFAGIERNEKWVVKSDIN